MDQTLSQILSELFRVLAQNVQLEAENTRLKQVIDSKLPIHNGTIEDLQRGEVVEKPA